MLPEKLASTLKVIPKRNFIPFLFEKLLCRSFFKMVSHLCDYIEDYLIRRLKTYFFYSASHASANNLVVLPNFLGSLLLNCFCEFWWSNYSKQKILSFQSPYRINLSVWSWNFLDSIKLNKNLPSSTVFKLFIIFIDILGISDLHFFNDIFDFIFICICFILDLPQFKKIRADKSFKT